MVDTSVINILRDHEGHSTRVMLNINNVFVPIPIDTKTLSIDWESIDYEPTRNSIKAAWDNWTVGKDLSIELADRPDLAPLPEKPKANWAVFNRLSVQSSAIIQILTTTTNQLAALKLQFISAPAGYSVNGLAKTDYPLFQNAWAQVIDALPQPPTPEMIAELNAIALSADMDFSFDESCKIVLADS